MAREKEKPAASCVDRFSAQPAPGRVAGSRASLRESLNECLNVPHPRNKQMMTLLCGDRRVNEWQWRGLKKKDKGRSLDVFGDLLHTFPNK